MNYFILTLALVMSGNAVASEGAWRFVYSSDPDLANKCDYGCNVHFPKPNNNTWIITAPLGLPECHNYNASISVNPINAPPTYLPARSMRLIVSDDWGALYYHDETNCGGNVIAMDELCNSCKGKTNVTLTWGGDEEHQSVNTYWKKCYCFTTRYGPCICSQLHDQQQFE